MSGISRVQIMLSAGPENCTNPLGSGSVVTRIHAGQYRHVAVARVRWRLFSNSSMICLLARHVWMASRLSVISDLGTIDLGYKLFGFSDTEF